MATQDQIRGRVAEQIIEALEKGETVPGVGLAGTPIPAACQCRQQQCVSWYQPDASWPCISIGTASVPAGTERSSSGGTWAARSCGGLTSAARRMGLRDHLLGEGDQNQGKRRRRRGREGHFYLNHTPSSRLTRWRASHLDQLGRKTTARSTWSSSTSSLRSVPSPPRKPTSGTLGTVPSTVEIPITSRCRRRESQLERVLFDLLPRVGPLERKADRVEGRVREGELRAEIAAAYMLAELGVPQSSDLSNHQAYVANWLQALRKDNRFIFRAGTAANKAADYILVLPAAPARTRGRAFLSGGWPGDSTGGRLQNHRPCLFGPPPSRETTTPTTTGT